MNIPLKIDPEFEAKCPPLTDEEYQQLEENILSEGLVLMPLIVWNGTIIDGHNRYKIAQAHPGIEFSAREKPFDNRFSAISWICKNQLGRRNLTPQQKKYLIGQRYEAERLIHGGDRKSSDAKSSAITGHLKSDSSAKTRKAIAAESKTSTGYVYDAAQFAKGVDAAETEIPGIKQEILTGLIKPAAKEVAAVAKAPPNERHKMAEELRVPKPKVSTKANPPIKPMSNTSRQELNEIRSIYADMSESGNTVNEDSVLETLHGAVEDMIRVCDTLFADFPRLLEDRTYKAKVIEIFQEPKNYIQQIEGAQK